MMLDVPFYKQTNPMNCGPYALKMVLSYFGKEERIEILENRIGINEGKGISTIQIATAAASFGYKADFYSKHVLLDENNLQLDFYKKYADIDLEKSRKLVADARAAGVNIQEKSMNLNELLSNVTENSIPVILIDWNMARGKAEKGYQGHIVPIVGYDQQNVYIHQHGLGNPQKFMPIEKKLFDDARKAQGTDEDIVVIHRV